MEAFSYVIQLINEHKTVKDVQLRVKDLPTLALLFA